MTSLTRRISVGLTTLGVAVAQLILPAQAALAYAPVNPPVDGKITICHSTQPNPSNGNGQGPQGNPYNQETVSLSAVDGAGQNDHTSHTGVAEGQPSHVYTPGALSWGDIIPAYGSYAGLNWGVEGQAIYNNECNIPAPAGQIETPTISLEGVCGLNNDLLTTSTSADYTASAPTWDESEVSVTFNIKAGVDKVFASNSEKTITISEDEVDTTACETPTIKPCKTITSSTVNKYEDFADYNDTRAKGRTAFVEDGLHIWTQSATSTDKVAWYNSVSPYTLADIGTPTMDYTNTAGVVPGMQIELDITGDGISDGILVGEPASYGDNWWSNASFGVGSGMGYNSYGTLQEYLDANPTAQVVAVGFSLGSGVKGDGVLHSITFGCETWIFKAKPHVAEPCTVKNNTYVAPWEYDEETYPFAGAWPEESEPATATFTDKGLYLTTPVDDSYTLGFIDAGNTSLADISTMSYKTWRDSSSTPYVNGFNQTLPAYILYVDTDGNTATDNSSYFFYEPYYNGTVKEDVWQTWSLTDSALWYESGTGQTKVTWDSLVAKYPDAKVLIYGFNQGQSNPGTNAYIESMTFDCATTAFVAGKGGNGGDTPTEPKTPVTPTAPSMPYTPGRGAVLPTELPETGASANGLMIALLAATAAYGALYFAQPKRKFDQ